MTTMQSPIELGFTFQNFVGNDRTHRILEAVNRLYIKGYNITLFMAERDENIFLSLPKFYISAAFDFKGILIANDPFTAQKICNYPKFNKRMYCMWEDISVPLPTITPFEDLSVKHSIPLTKELEYERFF